MKIRKILYIIFTCIIAVTAVSEAIPTAEAASAEAASSATAARKKSKKKSSGRKKNASSSKRTKKGGRKRTGKKSRNRKNTSRKVSKPAPPPEVVSYDSLTLRINDALVASVPKEHNPGGLRVNVVKADQHARTVRLQLNENFTYLPVTREMIEQMSDVARKAMPDSLRDLSISLNVGNRALAYYITKVDKLPEQYRKNVPFVYPAQPYVNADKGMQGDIVALWHSHGRYFKPGSSAWMWQRPVLFQTVEDMFPMSFILPFVTPMLENAGAYVMLPRERDTNTNEVIVDNDINPDGNIYSQPFYKEMGGSRKWQTGAEEGFIYDLPDFRDTENPFENGTYRQTTTVKGGAPAVAAWYADIPEDGEYAVYVSYKSLPNSTEDAHYTVNYSGGSREFRVNQTMGGGTWIYLGTFPLAAGYSDTEPVVTLTNISDKEADRIVTADAVKIGGGMGNIARSNRRSDIYYDPSTPDNDVSMQASTSGSDEAESDDDEEEEDEDEEGALEDGDEDGDGSPAASDKDAAASTPQQQKGPAPTFRTSGKPRFLEGARYWLQWAGAPESVYSPYHGSDDYKDDYTSRGLWVNWLAGGSRVLPDRDGLGIPVDVTMALHTDAGKRADDSIVGTLGIYYSNSGDSYVDGTPRINSRMLTDMLMRQITGDIRRTYESGWTRRQMWDKSYVEARVPEVPTALIELMSHQNFGDMRYGLDPGFRFTVGRAIYKALGRFVAERKGREFVVQPLPVKDFAITRKGKNHYRLQWKPTDDPIEPSAKPHEYIIFERTEGQLGFRKAGTTRSTHFDVKITDTLVHSFRVVAANEGGISFDSETLALRESPGGSKPVLIINGFSRVSAPASFADGSRAGFDSENDFGVPYLKDISFTGYQQNFSRSSGESFGKSASNHVQTVAGGNTFDYPYVHGEAIAAAGHGFVSASAGAVESGEIQLSDYNTIDLILGKQKTTVTGNGKSGVRFSTFPPELRDALRRWAATGGKLIVSGQYVASDLFDYRSGADARQFAVDVLGIDKAPESLTPSRSGAVSTESLIKFNPYTVSTQTASAADSISGGELSATAQRLNACYRDTPADYGFTPATYTYSTTLRPDHYIVEHPDILVPAEGTEAQTVLSFTDTGLPAALLTSPAAFKKGKGKKNVAVLSVPIESIIDKDMRALLIQQLLQQ